METDRLLEIARTLGLAMLRPKRPDFPHIPRLLATRIDKTTFCFVPPASIAASQARRSSSSSALDFAIALLLEEPPPPPPPQTLQIRRNREIARLLREK